MDSTITNYKGTLPTLVTLKYKPVSMIYTAYSYDTEVQFCFYGLHLKYKLKTPSIFYSISLTE